jgi:hypothetical protein
VVLTGLQLYSLMYDYEFVNRRTHSMSQASKRYSCCKIKEKKIYIYILVHDLLSSPGCDPTSHIFFRVFSKSPNLLNLKFAWSP